MPIIIRPSTESDIEAIHALILEFATFQKTPEAVSITVEQMKADKNLFQCFVAVDDTVHEDSVGEGVIGFATYFFAYYSWSGKALYLDDLYVKPHYRGQKIGTQLLDTIINFAAQNDCKKVRWQVSKWNTHAIDFYKKLGGEVDDIEINCNLILK